MLLAQELRSLVVSVAHTEAQNAHRITMLDGVFDLFNDLTDWATNTEHGDAALEVMSILEQYARKGTPQRKSEITDEVDISEALRPETAR